MMYDLIIIGAGSAGFSAYKEAIQHTQNILIINAGPWDTTCARVGCMPSKVLISSANQLHDAHHLTQVGILGQGMWDTSKVMQRVRTLRDDFTSGTQKEADSWNNDHKIQGNAQFINANTVQVNGKTYQAKSFILAVGSTPRPNSEWEKELKGKLLTSDTIFELPTLPKSLGVIGSGVIALELAQAMQRLGVKVTVFARSEHLGALTSPKLQKLAQNVIGQELNILFKTIPNKVSLNSNQKVEIQYDLQGQMHSTTVDYLLNATGRVSNLTSLNLEKIDSQFEDIKNLPIHSQTKQLGDYPIFVVGDAFTSTPVQHEASNEGKLAVHNCLNPNHLISLKPLIPFSITFCSPEMAMVGKSYKSLKNTADAFEVGFVSYEKQGRARVLGKNVGGIEIYADRTTHKVLGAELFCEDAEHLAHLLAWSMQESKTVEQLLQQPFYHPTLEEGLRTALRDLNKKLI